MSLKDFTSNAGDADTGSTPPGPPWPGGTGAHPSGPTHPSAADDDITSLLVNYNEKFLNAPPTQFRDEIIELALSILVSKNKPNPLLRGAAGVGKTKIVEDIARRIELQDPLIPAQLYGYTIYELPIAHLLAGTGIVGELENRMQELISFAENPDNMAIIFIDEIHQITGGSGDQQTKKVSQILKPILARGAMSVIGATTNTEARAFDDDPAFSRRFTHVLVDELTVEQTKEVLLKARASYAAHYQQRITLSDEVLHRTVEIAEQHGKAQFHRPDNALTLLDRAMASRLLEHQRLIAEATTAGDTSMVQALQSLTQLPLTEHRVLEVAKRLMTGHAKPEDFDLSKLECSLRERIIGQDQILDKLSDFLERRDLEAFPTRQPTALMFAGASGVGKTETAKLISEALTSLEPIILNMAEYHRPEDTAKIVGAPPGYIGSDSNKELPFDTLEANPYRVILLDELEKADRAVHRLLLSALDEGYMRTASGKRLDFSKAIVICTTNAAREALSRPAMGFGSSAVTLDHRSLNRQLEQHFDAEMLGRFSLVVGFQPIDKDTFQLILSAGYARERQRIVSQQPALDTVLSPSIDSTELDALTEAHFVETHGARPAGRAVRRWIEDHLLTHRRSQQAHRAATSALIAQAREDAAGDAAATAQSDD